MGKRGREGVGEREQIDGNGLINDDVWTKLRRTFAFFCRNDVIEMDRRRFLWEVDLSLRKRMLMALFA